MTLDWRVLAFTVVVALATGLLFGLIPALQGSGTDLNPSLKESSGRTGTGFRQNRIRSLLVIGEMSLALLLLIGAALLIRTLIALRSVTPGFDPRNVVTTRTPLEPASAKKSGVHQISRDVFQRLSGLPGVESVGYTRLLPLDGDFNSVPIIIVGRPLNGPSHASSRWMVDLVQLLRRAQDSAASRALIHGRGSVRFSGGGHHQSNHGSPVMAERRSAERSGFHRKGTWTKFCRASAPDRGHRGRRSRQHARRAPATSSVCAGRTTS